MRASDSCDRRLELSYKYFSHHLRTNTSVVVAMLDVIKEGLSDDSMMEMIMESGYLLDVFDRGMSITFNHILGKKESSEREDIDLNLLIDLFLKNAVPKDGSCELLFEIPKNCIINCDGYSFKSIFQIFLHEAVLASNINVTVTFSGNELAIIPDKGFNEINPIFSIFKEIFQKNGVETVLDISFIKLRF